MKILPSVLVLAFLLTACAAPPPLLSENEETLLAVGKRLVSESTIDCPATPTGALARDTLTVRMGQTVCARLREQDRILSLVPAPAGPDGPDTLVVRMFREPGLSEPVVAITNPLTASLDYQIRPRRTNAGKSPFLSFLPRGNSILALDAGTTEATVSGLAYLDRARLEACRRQVATDPAPSADCSLMVSLEKDAESVYMMKDPTPEDARSCDTGRENALVDGLVTVRPGESVCVRVEVRGNDVVPVAVVSTRSSKDVMVLRMARTVDPSIGRALLTVENPLDRPLRYEAALTRVGEQAGEYTSICPVAPGNRSHEIWPYAIREMRLRGFRLLPPGTPQVCG